MMMSLFSVFDPSSYFGISLNWLVILMVMLFIPMKYYCVDSEFGLMNKGILKNGGDLFKEIGSNNYLGMSFICIVTFFYLIVSNLMGLFPFIFTSTAHPMITMGLGGVMWVSFFFMGWFKNFKESMAHLVPHGSPIELAPFLVLIESVSHLIRPFTLSIRLAANMMAGHLIIGLLSSISMINTYGIISSILLQNILMLLEFAVGVIQGFVFSILLLLYALDYY
uniref:ATP synthase subunit a n=1 Tax=Argyroneta aquatica TaxID=375087 RepID=A0A6G7ISX3_ARGAQ|nr:ATP synthase F0 subunit 6 [Argyroneta aquatica]